MGRVDQGVGRRAESATRGLQLVHHETKTENEKEEVAVAFIHERMAEFYGQEYVAAVRELENATAGLPKETKHILDESGCSSSRFGR